MFSFVITHVFPGSERQVAAGIYATFNMDVVEGKDIVVSLKDLKLNKSNKDGKFYIGSPYREYQGKGEGGATEAKKVHFIKLWPEKDNWPKQDDIVKLVQQKLGSPTKPTTGNTAPTAKAAPVYNKPVAAKVDNDPWA